MRNGENTVCPSIGTVQLIKTTEVVQIFNRQFVFNMRKEKVAQP